MATRKVDDTLKEEYASSLAANTVKIFDLWTEYKLNFEDRVLISITDELHRIAGSAGVYGYEALGKEAKQIEIFLEEDKFDIEEVNQLMLDFKNEVNVALANKVSEVKLDEVLAIPTDIILIENDNLLKVSLTDQFKERDFVVKNYQNFSDFYDDKGTQLNLIFFVIANEDNLIEIDSDRIKTLKKAHGIPTILYSSKGDFNSRLRSIRFGASMYYNLPIDTTVLMDFIENESYNYAPNIYKVLIIDDSELLSKFYVSALNKVGIQADYVTEASESIDKIMEFEPDLLVVDLYMPYCSGIELVQIIRQYQRFYNIPILFLSSEKDPEIQAEAKEVGGEDFLEKSLSPLNLIKTIKGKLNKYRRINQLIEKDSLTGLYLRRKLEDELHNHIEQFQRLGTEFCYVLIDLDHFKDVNDTYGHSAGDGVLKSLSKVMRRSLRNQDIIFRYGGEEIALIMPNTHLDQAQKIVERIRKKFNDGKIEIGQYVLSLSFSSGISEYQEGMTKKTLMDLADQALYLAKASGRNQVKTFLELCDDKEEL